MALRISLVALVSAMGLALAFLEKAAQVSIPPLDVRPKLEATFGQLSIPYFLVSATIPGASSGMDSVAYVLDSRANVVKIFVFKGRVPAPHNAFAKPVSADTLALFSAGLQLIPTDSSQAVRNYYFPNGLPHHDVAFDGNSAFFGIFSRWVKSPANKDLQIDEIVRVNLGSGTTKTVWNSLQAFVPDDSAEGDWVHLNSIERDPTRGCLVSSRSRSALVLLSADCRQKRFSIGAFPGADFQPQKPSDAFYFQHHATFLPGGEFLLFDNRLEKSRAIAIHLDFKSGKFTVVKEFALEPELFSEKQGSAFFDKNRQSVFVFFPHVRELEGSHVFAEFDYATQQLKGSVTFRLGESALWGRAIAFESDDFLEKQPREQEY